VEHGHGSGDLAIANEQQHLSHECIVALSTCASPAARLCRTCTRLHKPLDEQAAITNTPRREALVKLMGRAVRAACATTRPSQEQVAEQHVPLEPTLDGQRIVPLQRLLQVLKHKHMCRRPVRT